jgi:hypothetical protein
MYHPRFLAGELMNGGNTHWCCRSNSMRPMTDQADNRSYGGEGVVADSSPTERIHGAFKRKTKIFR